MSTHDNLLEVRDLAKWYPIGGGFLGKPLAVVRAVDGVSFDVRRGEILGLVGESGSGKSTIGRTVIRLGDPPTGGSINFEGAEIAKLGRRELRPFRPRMQLVFQDPYSSLNPKMTVGEILSTPLRIHHRVRTAAEARTRVGEVLELVGLSPAHAERYPHEFSGGQRQRIGIARAIMLDPAFLVADEPVSALDVSVQAQVVNLLMEIRRRLGVTILFIAHDLAVVGYISDRIAVMYLGRIVEIAPTRALLGDPRHPYTEALLSAAPVPDPEVRQQRIILKGDMPSPSRPPSGCAFRTRCRYALPACADAVPPLREVAEGHAKACIRDDLSLRPARRAA